MLALCVLGWVFTIADLLKRNNYIVFLSIWVTVGYTDERWDYKEIIRAKNYNSVIFKYEIQGKASFIHWIRIPEKKKQKQNQATAGNKLK